ncbi:MAG TPA: hypothetical protein VEY14_10625 [Nocardioidaceae bacterium]|jgi:hypothetical protein|nr:hypothetical protein [Nocardioidaceae bacterium]
MTALLLALDPAQVKPGWIGLLVTLAMAVALALILVSFTHRLKKIDVTREQGPELESIDEVRAKPGSETRRDEWPPRHT